MASRDIAHRSRTRSARARRRETRYVSTRGQLLAALGESFASGNPAPRVSDGLGRWAAFDIVIEGDLRMTRGFEIQTNLHGQRLIGGRGATLLIESEAAAVAVGAGVAVRGYYASLEGIHFFNINTNQPPAAQPRVNIVGDYCTIEGCVEDVLIGGQFNQMDFTNERVGAVVGTRLLWNDVRRMVLDGSLGVAKNNDLESINCAGDDCAVVDNVVGVNGDTGGLTVTGDNNVIRGNRQVTHTTSFGINSGASGNVVSGNQTNGARIGVSGGGSNNAITGNHLGGGNIDTTLGGGGGSGNLVDGNTNTGTITVGGGDTQGDNT